MYYIVYMLDYRELSSVSDWLFTLVMIFCVGVTTNQRHKFTVEPPISGHPQDQKKCPLKGGVRLWEVKNVAFVCSWEHDQVTRGVCLREVSISGGFTVLHHQYGILQLSSQLSLFWGIK